MIIATYNFEDNFIVSEHTDNFPQLRRISYFMVGHKGYIAGGVFKNLFNNEPVKDVDIFFESRVDWIEAERYFKNNDDFEESYSNNKVTAFKDKKSGIIIELICFMYGTPQEMISKFDFTIVKFAYYKDYEGWDEDDDFQDIQWKVAYHKSFFEHLHLKRTVIDQSFDLIDKPINTLNRSYRYAKYGYQPCRETKVKIIESLRNVTDFTDEDLSFDLYNGFD